MCPGVGSADFRCEFFEVDVDGLRMEVGSKRSGKDKSSLALFLAFPALPLPVRFEPFLRLNLLPPF